ncbi:MAG: SUMF1/EgtB/PvdO family nonheme iron enzyme [Methylococcaceae bacterium]|nr:SUMF1/EgtB/PvdO family nonheme iron enzyme [Methylococcaceae bacterium]
MSRKINFQSSFFMQTQSLSKDALAIDRVIHDYQIKGYLSDDFFGVTYLAYHQQTKKTAVIREYFPTELSVRELDGFVVPIDDETKKEIFNWGLDYFVEESQKLQSISHKNIVEVIDCFKENGTAYRVTKYYKGQTLKQWLSIIHSLDKPPPSEKKLLKIFMPILDALIALHEDDYLHRNIKPANIYLCASGRPLLIDFGASKQAIANKMGSLNLSLSSGYAAKEQYSSRGNLSVCTDIYALSASLYYAVIGKKPIAALDRGEARDEGMADPLIAASQAGKKYYRPEFLHVIDRGLAYLPKERPQTVLEFKRLLIEQQYKNKKNHRAYKTSSSNKMLLGGGGVIFIGSLLLLFTYQQSSQTKQAHDVSNKTKKIKTVAIDLNKKVIKKKSVNKKVIDKPHSRFPSLKTKVDIVNKKPWKEENTGMKFIWIPKGDFIIGNNTGIAKKSDKRLFIEGFWMGVYEVTIGQYRQFIKKTAYKTAAGDNCNKNDWGNPNISPSDEHPVTCVSWLDVQTYIKWLNEKSGKEFRLPTEAQWEYACRKGSERQTYCGDKPLPYLGYYDTGISERKSQPVGLKSTNTVGLHDMTGNVWEWTASEYTRFYNGKEMEWLSPDTPIDSSKRVMFRGGSAMYEEQYATSVYRGSPSSVKLSYDDVGFRLISVEAD